MKKIATLFFLLIFSSLLFSCVPYNGSGHSERTTEIVYRFNGSSQTYDLVSFLPGSGGEEEYEISSSYNDGDHGTFPVSTIKSFAFSDCVTLKKVIIPETIETIESGAFYRCANLASVDISSRVKTIERSAFFNCSNISEITVSQKNPYYYSSGNCLIETETKALLLGSNTGAIPQDEGITEICENAFYGCKEITSVTVPETVVALGTSAFCECSSLKEVSIGKNVKSIGDKCFYQCAIEEITLPDRLEYAGKRSFSQCDQLKKINLGKGIVYLMDNIFEGCTSLSKLTIPESVMYMGKGFISGCSGLKRITFTGEDSHWYTTNDRDVWTSRVTRGLTPIVTNQSISSNISAYVETEYTWANRYYLTRATDFR